MDFLVAFVSVLAGALLGFFGERWRRKNSLVDDRLHKILAAIAHIEKASNNLSVLRDYRADSATELQKLAVPRVAELHAGGADVIPAGGHAADALGDELLADTIEEAVGLLNSLSEKFDFAVREALETKLGEAHTHYEALRTKLFKLL